jgi:inositol-phosphate transport system substrate-binding protein
MKRILLFAGILILAAFALAATGQKEGAAAPGPVSLEALTIGPGPVPVTRAQNLEAAAEKLRAQGVDLTMKVTFSTQKFDAYRTNFSLAHRSGTAPDILSEDQDILPEYAREGMILPLDEYVRAAGWKESFDDFLPGLWDAVSWQSKIYGIPIEAVVNCIYYNKEALRGLGLSDAEIESTFSVDSGRFTLETLVDLARRAKQAGLVEWGFTHRPGAGDYWFNTVMAFGGRIVDPATGSLVIDREALRRDFQFHRMLVDEKLLPADMASWDWKVIHKYTVEGRTLFWIGGHSGQWKEYQDVAYHEQLGKVSEDFLQKNLGIAPFPGVNGPVTPVKVHAYTLVSTAKHPDVAFRAISEAATPELLARHAVTTFRGPARSSVAGQEVFRTQAYLQQVLRIMRYSQAFPKHPALGAYGGMLYEAMAGVETGRLSVDQAVEFMTAKARADVPGVTVR